MTKPSPTIRDSDIAIVGMACRFPGAKNVDLFWQNLREGFRSYVGVVGPVSSWAVTV